MAKHMVTKAKDSDALGQIGGDKNTLLRNPFSGMAL